MLARECENSRCTYTRELGQLLVIDLLPSVSMLLLESKVYAASDRTHLGFGFHALPSECENLHLTGRQVIRVGHDCDGDVVAEVEGGYAR